MTKRKNSLSFSSRTNVEVGGEELKPSTAPKKRNSLSLENIDTSEKKSKTKVVKRRQSIAIDSTNDKQQNSVHHRRKSIGTFLEPSWNIEETLKPGINQSPSSLKTSKKRKLVSNESTVNNINDNIAESKTPKKKTVVKVSTPFEANVGISSIERASDSKTPKKRKSVLKAVSPPIPTETNIETSLVNEKHTNNSETKTPKKRKSVLKVATPTVTNIETASVTNKSISKENQTPKSPQLSAKKLEKRNSVRKSKKQESHNENSIILDPKDDLNQYMSKISKSQVKEAVEGVIKLATNNPKLQNDLFNETFSLMMQVACFKIPKGYSKIFRVPLKHSLITKEDDVCLIVPEVKGIGNKDHERHIEHYEEILRKKGVTGIKKIMTFHEFRTEYEPFELKSKLVDTYDRFLVDGKISGKVVQKCGKIFYKKRKVPTPVKLHVTKLKEHIEQKLSTAYLHVHLKGDCNVVEFGNNKMKTDDLVNNVFSIIEFLGQQFPGGFENIRNIELFTHRSTSIPIYLSTKLPANLKVPVMQPKKPKAFKTFRGELTTTTNKDVIVNPFGKIKVVPSKNDESKNNHEESRNSLHESVLADEEIVEKAEKSSNKKKKRKLKHDLEEQEETQEQQPPKSKKDKKERKAKGKDKLSLEKTRRSTPKQKKPKIK